MLLNRKMVKDLRAILDDALNDNESLEQFIVDIGSANFNDTEVPFKVNLRMKGAKSQSEKDLEFYGNMDNLDLTKVAKRRHQHEIFQAKLLRKELKNE